MCDDNFRTDYLRGTRYENKRYSVSVCPNVLAPELREIRAQEDNMIRNFSLGATRLSLVILPTLELGNNSGMEI